MYPVLIEVTMAESGKKAYINANYVTQILPGIMDPDNECYIFVQGRPTLRITGSASEAYNRILRESAAVGDRMAGRRWPVDR